MRNQNIPENRISSAAGQGSIKAPARLAAALLIVLSVLAAGLYFAEEADAKGYTGPKSYKGKLCFFKNGRVAKGKKERILKAKGYYYYVLKNGRIRKGWNIKGKALYYFNKKGRMVRDKKIHGIMLLPNGKAQFTKKSKGKKKKSLNAYIKYKCIRVLKKRGVYNKSKKKQLRSAWNYLQSHKVFRYGYVYPGPYKKDSKWPKNWPKKLAYIMLTKHKGNCYGFACCFAAFAHTIGYDPYVYYGYVRGGRDASMGLTNSGWTRHSCTRINGKWYDPEYWFMYKSHYTYGAKHLSYSFKNKKSRRFKKVPGSVSSNVKTIAGNLKRIGKRYYYFNSKGDARKGVYYIKKKIYNFKTKAKYGWSMTVEEQEELQRAIKKGKKFEDLKDLIGKPLSSQDACDEYADSVAYFYKRIYVAAHKNSDGDYVIHRVGVRE